MDHLADPKLLQDAIQATLISTTRTATSLSAGDISFQRSLDPNFATSLDSQNSRLLDLAARLLQSAAVGPESTSPKLSDAEAIDSNWRDIVEVIDGLLEKTGTSIDEYTGAVKRLSPAADQGAVTPRAQRLNHNTLAKPQLLFEHVPKNNETGGFKPLITSKPHAKQPLEESLQTYVDVHGREQYPHPYQIEIESYEYPRTLYQRAEPVMYTPFESTTATYVDTPEALAEMLSELKTAKEIAIDLEHHDNRSYIGIVSLMQISTRNKDWIVDTLKPWRRRLECLNEVFADPRILKVLHGAYMDIVWLQRDLGLYIVGLFDTFHAARTLAYPAASLAFLLKKFVNFDAQKQYQTADWRIRPLPEEFLTYARADTHFLLYIFDNIRNELIDRSNFFNPEQDKIRIVLEKSKETALQRYEHPIYDAELGLGSVGWYRLLSRTPVTYSPEQFSVFKAVHQWRDGIARLEDESPIFVMPNHAIFTIARTLPEDKTAIFKAIQHVSPIVRMRIEELVSVIIAARVAGKKGPDINEELARVERARKGFRQGTVAEASGAKAVDVPIPRLVSTQAVSPRGATQRLRADSSGFWGKLLADHDKHVQSNISSISLALPLPPLTAEVFVDPKSMAVEDEAPESGAASPLDQGDSHGANATEVFIVKQLGGARKRKYEESLQQARAEVTGDEHDVVLLDQEATRKAEKKARKKEKKRQALSQGLSGRDGRAADGEDMAQTAVFDYASAPSVLRAQHVEKGSSKSGEDSKKRKNNDEGFKPFSGISSAPQGLRRSRKESAGRTKTFSS